MKESTERRWDETDYALCQRQLLAECNEMASALTEAGKTPPKITFPQDDVIAACDQLEATRAALSVQCRAAGIRPAPKADAAVEKPKPVQERKLTLTEQIAAAKGATVEEVQAVLARSHGLH